MNENNNTIDNVIMDPDYNNKRYLYCFKCPTCNTIFTMRFEYKLDGYFEKHIPKYANCPCCKVRRDWNWSACKISKTHYKFIRAWRDLKERFNKEVTVDASESEDGTMGTGR